MTACTLITDADGGCTIGFWLTDSETADLSAFTYRSYADNFNITITDETTEMVAMIPATNGEWTTLQLTTTSFVLSSYQPDHPETDPRPNQIDLHNLKQINLAPDTDPVDGVSARIDWYCVNAVPELYTSTGGDDYTMYFRITVSGDNPYSAKLGDCTIIDYKTNSLHYTPCLIPFSNISDPNTALYDGWRGLPYRVSVPYAVLFQRPNTTDKIE